MCPTGQQFVQTTLTIAEHGSNWLPTYAVSVMQLVRLWSGSCLSRSPLFGGCSSDPCPASFVTNCMLLSRSLGKPSARASKVIARREGFATNFAPLPAGSAFVRIGPCSLRERG